MDAKSIASLIATLFASYEFDTSVESCVSINACVWEKHGPRVDTHIGDQRGNLHVRGFMRWREFKR